jgi:hypothetical protein
MKGRDTMELESRVKEWKRLMSDVDCGPLAIAHEVVELANRWEAEGFHKSTRFRNVTAFLSSEFGRKKGLAYFTARASAVDALGEHIRRSLNHQVAIWIYNKVPQVHRDTVVRACIEDRKNNGSNCVSLSRAKVLATQICGSFTQAREKCCPRCGFPKELASAAE